MRSVYVVGTHGYSGYTGGCRCDICRSAKAEYMRDRRSQARRRAARSERLRGVECWPIGIIRFTATGVTHGTRSAYDEHGCRCFDCTDHARTWKASPNGSTQKEAA